MEKRTKIELVAVAAVTAIVMALGICGYGNVFTRRTLTLDVNGETQRLYVLPGEAADLSGVSAGEGMRIVCWLDESGGEADLTQPVEGSASYTALVAPALAEGMEPWLEPDEYGLAHPDSPVTGAELAAGAAAMFAGGTDFPELAALETVSASELASALDGLLAPALLASVEGDAPLTRIEAADIIYPLYMTSLYGEAWGYDEMYTIAAADLDPLREGAKAMAACLDDSAAVRYGEGFVNLGGYLYRADDMGLFYMDKEADGLYYGPDGRFTSGSEELDALVAEVLEPICAEYETREEMLRAAYLYVRDSFTYLRRNYYNVGDDGWQIDEALTMFTTGRGNCYCYAAAFWALARGLGYDATAVAGTVGWDRDPHGWVIMYDADGNRVTYDVELEMSYRVNRHRYDVDMYAMNSWKAAQWNYIYGEQFQ